LDNVPYGIDNSQNIHNEDLYELW